eukprot:111931-Pelagomonas_calceolata.AAC.1
MPTRKPHEGDVLTPQRFEDKVIIHIKLPVPDNITTGEDPANFQLYTIGCVHIELEMADSTIEEASAEAQTIVSLAQPYYLTALEEGEDGLVEMQLDFRSSRHTTPCTQKEGQSQWGTPLPPSPPMCSNRWLAILTTSTHTRTCKKKRKEKSTQAKGRVH